MIKSGIYKIKNIRNNMIYIGSSINIEKRWKEHIRLLKNNKHDNQFLQNAWNKCDGNDFDFEIVEIVNNTELLTDIEQLHLDRYRPFNKNVIYNICEYANNMLGFKHSEETKEKMSNFHKGNKYCLGFKHSEETKEKMSLLKTGKKHEFKTKVKMKNKSLNRKQKPETKKILSEKAKIQKNNYSRKVVQLDINDNIINIWNSLSEASDSVNASITQICGVCSGRHKTCRGYKWMYLEKPTYNKVSIELEYEINYKYNNSDVSIRGLANEYNLSKGVINRIIKKPISFITKIG